MKKAFAKEINGFFFQIIIASKLIRLDSINSTLNGQGNITPTNKNVSLALSTVVNKFKNSIATQQAKISSPMNKQTAVKRIQRFFSDHNNDINRLFDDLLQFFYKQTMKEKSLTTRIEDLYEQKKKNFDEIEELSKQLRILIKDAPKKMDRNHVREDSNVNFIIEEEMDRILKKNPDTTVVELKLNYHEVGKKIEEDDETLLEAIFWNFYLFFNEILFRFSSMVRTICDIQNSSFSNQLYLASSRMNEYSRSFKNKFVFEADPFVSSELASRPSVNLIF